MRLIVIGLVLMIVATIVNGQCSPPLISLEDEAGRTVCVTPAEFSAGCSSCRPEIHICGVVSSRPRCLCRIPYASTNLTSCGCGGPTPCPANERCVYVTNGLNDEGCFNSNMFETCLRNCRGECRVTQQGGTSQLSIQCVCTNGAAPPSCNCTDTSCVPVQPGPCDRCTGDNERCEIQPDPRDPSGPGTRVCVCINNTVRNILTGRCEPQPSTATSTPGAPCTPCNQTTPCGCVAPLQCNPVAGRHLCQCPPGQNYNPANNQCVPRQTFPSAAPGVCSAHGDPHYNGFDGSGYPDNTFCDVVLAQCGNFTAHLRQGVCTRGGVTPTIEMSCVDAVAFTGTTGQPVIEVYTSPSLTAYVDGVLTSTSFSDPANGILHFECFPINQSCVATLDNNNALRIFTTSVTLQLSGSCRGRTTGMCGNFNGNPSDDGLDPANYIPEGSSLFTQPPSVNATCSTGSKRSVGEGGPIDVRELLPACDPVLLHEACKSILELENVASYVNLDDLYEQCCFDNCGNYFLPEGEKLPDGVLGSSFNTAAAVGELYEAINQEFPDDSTTTGGDDTSTTGGHDSSSTTGSITGSSTTGSQSSGDSSTTATHATTGPTPVPNPSQQSSSSTIAPMFLLTFVLMLLLA